MLREAVRSLDMTVLHYDADCIIAFVDSEPEIKHVILTESETGLYLVNAPIEKMGIDVLLQSSSFTLIQTNIPFGMLLRTFDRPIALRMQGIRFR